MNILLDTHVLLWAAGEPKRLSAKTRKLLDDPQNTLLFSAASLWEIGIKHGLGRADFQADPWLLRRGLIDNGYQELPILGQHALAILDLPAIHKDPFDRMLIAQATFEGMLLLTADPIVIQYPGPIRKA